MILSQLSNRKLHQCQSLQQTLNSNGLHHLTCNQLRKLTISNDDIHYNTHPISRILLLGTIITHHRTTNHLGMPIIQAKLKDNSGICTIRFLYNETIEDILSIKDYVKVFANVKCVMVNYQYQIGIVGVTVVKVEYFDQLTCHLLECLRSQMKHFVGK